MKVRFTAKHQARFVNKLKTGKNMTRYYFEVSVREIENLLGLKDWLEVNPRCQNLTSKPAKAMIDTLESDECFIFHLLNKGIAISADVCKVTQTATGIIIVDLELTDKELHGILDGAHTFSVLANTLKTGCPTSARVTLEVLIGIDEYICELAKARNTSIQVKNKSIANLEGKFDFIKEALVSERYFNDISWKENEGSIDITKIIQILCTMNPACGFKTYRNSGRAEKLFISEYEQNIENHQINNSFYRLKNIMSDFLALYDSIYESFSTAYGKGFAQIKSFKHKSYKLDFLQEIVSYQIPSGLILMILSSLKNLIVLNDETGFYEWQTSPFIIYEKASSSIVRTLVKRYLEDGSNIVNFTKQGIHWQTVDLIIKETCFDYRQQLLKQVLKQDKVEKKGMRQHA